MGDVKFYAVNIPIVKGGALDRRIQALCEDKTEEWADHVVQMAVVTGIVDHMHSNLGQFERNPHLL